MKKAFLTAVVFRCIWMCPHEPLFSSLSFVRACLKSNYKTIGQKALLLSTTITRCFCTKCNLSCSTPPHSLQTKFAWQCVKISGPEDATILRIEYVVDILYSISGTSTSIRNSNQKVCVLVHESHKHLGIDGVAMSRENADKHSSWVCISLAGCLKSWYMGMYIVIFVHLVLRMKGGAMPQLGHSGCKKIRQLTYIKNQE